MSDEFIRLIISMIVIMHTHTFYTDVQSQVYPSRKIGSFAPEYSIAMATDGTLNYRYKHKYTRCLHVYSTAIFIMTTRRESRLFVVFRPPTKYVCRSAFCLACF